MRNGVPPDLKTVALITSKLHPQNGVSEVFLRSDAVLRVMRRLPFPWKLAYAGVIFPKPFRDFCYKKVAKNRYRLFGGRDKVE